MTLRPPGIAETVQPYPGNMQRCPECKQRRFDYMGEDYGACERRSCGYEWQVRSLENQHKLLDAIVLRFDARLVEGGEKLDGRGQHPQASVDKTPGSTPLSTSPAHEQPELFAA